MITTRDNDVIEFLAANKVARTSTIAEIFFDSPHACYKRLQVMVNEKAVKRMREHISCEYIYYFKKIPKQLKHSLMVTDFYRELHKATEVSGFKIEPVLGDIRPDAIFTYKSKGDAKLGVLEVEISNKGFNAYKYEKFYSSNNYKNFLPIMPTVFVVGDKVKLPDDTKVNYILVKTDFSNLKV